MAVRGRRQPHCLAAGPPDRRRRVEQLPEVDREAGQCHLVGIEPGQVEQVSDQPLQSRRLAPDDPTNLGDPIRGDDPVGQRLGIPADGGERSAQVV